MHRGVRELQCAELAEHSLRWRGLYTDLVVEECDEGGESVELCAEE